MNLNMIYRLLLLFCCCGIQTLQGQILNIEDKRSARTDSTGIYGNIDLGFKYVQNGSTIVTWAAAGQMEWLKEKNLLLLLGNFQKVTINDGNFINQNSGHLRYNRTLNNRWTLEAFAQGQFDERLRIGFRALLGSGARLQLLKTDEQQLYLGLAYMYEYDQVFDSTLVWQDNRMSSYFSFNLKPLDNLIFTGTTYYQPVIGLINEFRLSSNTSLLIRITDRFSLRSSFSITYDTRLSRELPDVPSTTYNFINALRWEF